MYYVFVLLFSWKVPPSPELVNSVCVRVSEINIPCDLFLEVKAASYSERKSFSFVKDKV